MKQRLPDIKIIYVEDSDDVRFACEQTMMLAGYQVIALANAEQGLQAIEKEPYAIVVTDVRLPGISGLELLNRARARDSDLPVILITGHGDVEMAVEAMRNGAYDFIEKPCSSEKLLEVVGRAVEKRRLVVENRQLKNTLQQEKGPLLIGRSPVMNELRDMLMRIAGTGADVLIHGETGCGKEVVARALHHWNNTARGHFVALNCAGLPESLFESEIFGHEQGAFTGAMKRRIGKIEHADGGTLFLDEIEGMSLAMQAKLLRVLQERTLERLGANQLIPVNCRVVAATKVDLLQLGEQGKFRLDLYYRLNVVTLRIPPLRERREDIPELFYWFASQAAQNYHQPLPEISPILLAWLQAQSWPGNVRELKHTAERFVLGLLRPPQSVSINQQEECGLNACIDAFEKKLIEDMLRQTGGQVSLTARQLMLPRKTLYDKLNKHQIHPQAFRAAESTG
ncbi:two-component system C4-dicarboxylate transport response regulator DctD [Gibbsiella quercinecans]|uniref:Fis family transcriptional regulator n=1 Tax=Gibbsiella quercinecans TaxID=929813 RepID=A0A250B527_9GAMM|nr:sigma-54 dependent transcriptional regulator [Gibbsiella quercinecans]ATA21279.1 Fis family transcriptional regulator [Gibbsiella quercinecans]RLM07395.1 Fis family transcriptional regulator [Gibbsiella quercinecans]RLM13450.1 Fis family transcriptional regulator [Gibbsiella quercinecans]TCT88511.1 two-component system C4-dicarboxylate transport response regulator DctD [Gibbsiella quercinecans]